MKIVKTCAAITLAAFLSLACGSPEAENKNATQNANKPAAASSNANSSEGAAMASSANSNASATPANANAAKAPADSKSASKVDAAALYVSERCSGCHGPDGKGKVKGAPNFTDAAWQKKETDASLAEGIKKGSVPKMPAFGSKLSDDEIKALVAYVRTFSGK